MEFSGINGHQINLLNISTYIVSPSLLTPADIQVVREDNNITMIIERL